MGKRTKNIFATADWHIGHKNVLEYDNRPFKDLHTMHMGLIRRFNATVSDNDVCYFLGDMGICTSELLGWVIAQLNGTKILILGNHDKGVEAMHVIGFDAVMYSSSMVIANEMVSMTHCPLRGVRREDTSDMNNAVATDNWHGEHRQNNFSKEDVGQFHLHGHIHSPNGGKSVRELGRQYDVGVAANKYCPVSISKIEKFIHRVKMKEKEVS